MRTKGNASVRSSFRVGLSALALFLSFASQALATVQYNINGTAFQKPLGWYDQNDDANDHAWITMTGTPFYASVSTVAGNTWGKVTSYSQSVNTDTDQRLKIVVSSIQSGDLKVGIFQMPWSNEHTYSAITVPGTYYFSVSGVAGYTGTVDMGVELIVEGGTGSGVVAGPIMIEPFPANTPTHTPTFSPTLTFTRTSTVTHTPTMTRTRTASPTYTASLTATVTSTAGTTNTATSTPTLITTETHTPTMTRTRTASPTYTASLTATATSTAGTTNTATSTPTMIATETHTPTMTRTRTASPTYTASLTATATSTVGTTNTATSTETSTSTMTRTSTISPTSTRTPTVTMTSTAETTNTATSTPTMIATETHTATSTRTLSATVTMTRTPGNTSTQTPTIPGTMLPTSTITSTVTATGTAQGVTSTATRVIVVEPPKGQVLPYPNPASNEVKFQVAASQTGAAKVEIFNMTGERVALLNATLTGTLGQTITWDCSSIAPGIYLARVIVNGTEIQKTKFAIVRK